MKKPASKRHRRVSHLLQRKVATLVCQVIKDPRLKLVSITAVDLSPDLRNAHIYYVVPDEIDKPGVDQALGKAQGFIRYQLSLSTELRFIPRIQFCYDHSIDRARRLLSLMESGNR